MLKRILSILAASIGIGSALAVEPPFVIGAATFVPPSGWRVLKKEEERIVFLSSDDRQHATISLMRFGAVPSFENFKRLCTLRVQAEKKGAPDAFIEPDVPVPFERKDGYGVFLSGGEKKTGRIFSGYLSSVGKELITIYVEAVGVTPKEHLASFEAFVTGLKRR